MPRSFRLRGIVEGFYGRPWSHEARLDVLSFVAERGMNAYLYAPKDDPKHRAAWRDPYDDVQMAQFRALADHAKAIGIRFGFAISPGLDIDYASNTDRAALLEKLGPFVDAGVNWFLLALDDIPAAADLAPRQADIAGWLFDALRKERDDTAMVLCPTEYIGTHPSPYLTDLGRLLPTEIDVMWTGPTVCSPVITADAAAGWRAALGGRPPLVWDNYPVNDGAMEPSLHLGPYRGRDPELADTTVGILCNPMRHPQASKIALATAADFMRDPDAYDPVSSWRRAIDAVGGDRRGPLRVLAEACADGPLCEPSELDLARRVADVREEIDGPGWTECMRNTAEMLRATKRVRDDFAGDDALAQEVAPWAEAAALEADLGLAALRLLQQTRPVATIDGNVGRAAAVDPDAAMQTAFMVLYVWTAARRSEHVVFGPRFAFYPNIVQLADGKPALDISGAVREDCNAIDALCRLALREYDVWQAHANTTVRVFVDGVQRPLDSQGCFDARGDIVLVRDDRNCTRMGAGDLLPFRDNRLS